MNRSARAKLLRRSRSLYTTEQVREHLQIERESHQVALKNQRARVRGARLAPKRDVTRNTGSCVAGKSETPADVLLAHLGEVT